MQLDVLSHSATCQKPIGESMEECKEDPSGDENDDGCWTDSSGKEVISVLG